MRVAISGSTGLIGGALAASLRRDGHEVLGISRRGGPDAVEWDPRAGKIDRSALEGADAIVNLAGESIQGRWTSSKKERIMRSRVDSTSLLAGVLTELDRRPTVFVSGSAVGYYGDRGDEVLAEDAPPGTGFLAEVAGAWERAAQPISALGIRLACARTSIVLSPEGGALARMRLITKFFLGGPLGGGEQYWSWITLDDEVRALRLLLDADIEGPVNLAAPEPVRQRAFAKALAEVLHRPAVLPAPGFAIRAALGEMGDALLLDSQRVVPGVLTDAGFVFGAPDLATALQSLFGG
jgi:uncharacterized protein (TIGR01777 family)